MGIAVFGAVFVDVKGYPDPGFNPKGRNSGRVRTVHGGVARNVAEDLANVELRPVFVSLVDDTGMGEDVIKELDKHKADTRYIRRVPDGMGTWLAIFDNTGDVAASVSKRPDLKEIGTILDECGDEIIGNCDSAVVEIDMDASIVKKIFALAKKYGKTVYGVVSNMNIAVERRDFLKNLGCFVCNRQEAGLLFSEDYENVTPEEMEALLPERIRAAEIPAMVVTLGPEGAVYASAAGEHGFSAPLPVEVKDTTGAGDSFFAGVAAGLTYGKTLGEACMIGTRLANAVIATQENVCPRFLPGEFGLEV
ncbi:MAG: carbohydrate kinase family protein [Lachnospiraceae bacterium]|nr:carbohydrate kinase family protein [Lachnospiraceae bacterium]